MEVDKPCCRQQQLEDGQVIPEDFVCFRFGSGLCQPLSSIGKLDEYAQLVKFATADNVLQLIGQYQGDDSNPEVTLMDSELDGIPTERDDGLTKPDDFTTEPDDFTAEPDAVPLESDDALTKPDGFTTEPDAVLIERDNVLTELNTAPVEFKDLNL